MKMERHIIKNKQVNKFDKLYLQLALLIKKSDIFQFIKLPQCQFRRIIQKQMFGQYKSNSQRYDAPKNIQLKSLFNKSSNVQSVLCGSPEVNHNYFIDSLERFKKDYSVFNKQQRQVQQMKKMQALKKKHECSQNFLQTLSTVDHHKEMKKVLQQDINNYMFDKGLKKNGMTTGIPINPVNHQYSNTYGGKQFKKEQTEKELDQKLRLHHLQNRSTCGYNVINGKQNSNVLQTINPDLQPGMASRIRQYQRFYSMKAPYY